MNSTAAGHKKLSHEGLDLWYKKPEPEGTRNLNLKARGPEHEADGKGVSCQSHWWDSRYRLIDVAIPISGTLVID